VPFKAGYFLNEKHIKE